MYGEGIFVGYRYYDHKKIEPRFAFGHGLSYTQFEYSEIVLNATEYAPGESIEVSLDVANIGSRSGQEVVQLYVRDVESSRARPERELKAFAKVTLAPGEKQTVEFSLDERALAAFNPSASAWEAEPGEFEVQVGASSRDLRARASFSRKAS